MILVPDWRRVLKRAWSIRLMMLAGLLSGVEVFLGLPDIQLYLDWPPGIFAGLSFLATAAAFVARLLAQSPGASNADQQDHQK